MNFETEAREVDRVLHDLHAHGLIHVPVKAHRTNMLEEFTTHDMAEEVGPYDANIQSLRADSAAAKRERIVTELPATPQDMTNQLMNISAHMFVRTVTAAAGSTAAGQRKVFTAMNGALRMGHPVHMHAFRIATVYFDPNKKLWLQYVTLLEGCAVCAFRVNLAEGAEDFRPEGHARMSLMERNMWRHFTNPSVGRNAVVMDTTIFLDTEVSKAYQRVYETVPHMYEYGVLWSLDNSDRSVYLLRGTATLRRLREVDRQLSRAHYMAEAAFVRDAARFMVGEEKQPPFDVGERQRMRVPDVAADEEDEDEDAGDGDDDVFGDTDIDDLSKVVWSTSKVLAASNHVHEGTFQYMDDERPPDYEDSGRSVQHLVDRVFVTPHIFATKLGRPSHHWQNADALPARQMAEASAAVEEGAAAMRNMPLETKIRHWQRRDAPTPEALERDPALREELASMYQQANLKTLVSPDDDGYLFYNLTKVFLRRIFADIYNGSVLGRRYVVVAANQAVALFHTVENGSLAMSYVTSFEDSHNVKTVSVDILYESDEATHLRNMVDTFGNERPPAYSLSGNARVRATSLRALAPLVIASREKRAFSTHVVQLRFFSERINYGYMPKPNDVYTRYFHGYLTPHDARFRVDEYGNQVGDYLFFSYDGRFHVAFMAETREQQRSVVIATLTDSARQDYYRVGPELMPSAENLRFATAADGMPTATMLTDVVTASSVLEDGIVPPELEDLEHFPSPNDVAYGAYWGFVDGDSAHAMLSHHLRHAVRMDRDRHYQYERIHGDETGVHEFPFTPFHLFRRDRFGALRLCYIRPAGRNTFRTTQERVPMRNAIEAARDESSMTLLVDAATHYYEHAEHSVSGVGYVYCEDVISDDPDSGAINLVAGRVVNSMHAVQKAHPDVAPTYGVKRLGDLEPSDVPDAALAPELGAPTDYMEVMRSTVLANTSDEPMRRIMETARVHNENHASRMDKINAELGRRRVFDDVRASVRAGTGEADFVRGHVQRHDALPPALRELAEVAERFRAAHAYHSYAGPASLRSQASLESLYNRIASIAISSQVSIMKARNQGSAAEPALQGTNRVEGLFFEQLKGRIAQAREAITEEPDVGNYLAHDRVFREDEDRILSADALKKTGIMYDRRRRETDVVARRAADQGIPLEDAMKQQEAATPPLMPPMETAAPARFDGDALSESFAF